MERQTSVYTGWVGGWMDGQILVYEGWIDGMMSVYIEWMDDRWMDRRVYIVTGSMHGWMDGYMQYNYSMMCSLSLSLNLCYVHCCCNCVMLISYLYINQSPWYKITFLHFHSVPWFQCLVSQGDSHSPSSCVFRCVHVIQVITSVVSTPHWESELANAELNWTSTNLSIWNHPSPINGAPGVSNCVQSSLFCQYGGANKFWESVTALLVWWIIQSTCLGCSTSQKSIWQTFLSSVFNTELPPTTSGISHG